MKKAIVLSMLPFLSINTAFSQDDGDWKIATVNNLSSSGQITKSYVLYPHPSIPGEVKIGIGTSTPTFLLSLGASTAKTKLALYDKGPGSSYGMGVLPGSFRFHLNGPGARFAFFDSDEENAKEIFTIYGKGRVKAPVIEITGGSDLAEPFEINAPDSIQPGMVVSIDPNFPGQLRIADAAHDRTVAGIVSGANGLNPGLTMRQQDTLKFVRYPVALTGRVYCLATTANGTIRPGDFLTTSDIPGHAMKVTNYAVASGAILGKAMSALDKDKGFVLVLVSLQ